MTLRRRPALAAALSAAFTSPRRAQADAADDTIPYCLPDSLPMLPFGTHSHWLQPWRAYCDTIPAAAFARGYGTVWDDIATPVRPGSVALLAAQGFTTIRTELGWGHLDFATERTFDYADNIHAMFAQCRAARVRPLILLNGNQGGPVPATTFTLETAAAASKGARAIQTASTLGLFPGRSGLNHLTDTGIMAEVIVTAIEGRWLTLSKPLPRAVQAGETLSVSTLRYEPFAAPGSKSNEATIAGWLRYVDAVAAIAGPALSQRGGQDRGFDLEIWNELSFGSAFLDIASYYDPKPADAPARVDDIWTQIVDRTAAHVAANPAAFAGVALVNGFSNTVPWPAASTQPTRVTAISKHPYPPRNRYPANEQHGPAIGADGKPTDFVPSYTAYFPEYFATAIQTEMLWRDLSPGPNKIGDAAHGRLARKRPDGKTLPVDVWLTEIGIGPGELGIKDVPTAERLKTRFVLRTVLFYLGKGVSRVYLFRAFGDAFGPGLLPSTEHPTATPPVTALARAIRTITEGAAFDGPVRPLQFSLFAGDGAAELFAGNGQPGTPPLRASDGLVLLPFQSAPGRFAIAYYVMTRDVRVPAAAQDFRIRVAGLAGDRVTADAYDPVTGRSAAVTVIARAADSVTIRVPVTDTPRLLLLRETAA